MVLFSFAILNGFSILPYSKASKVIRAKEISIIRLHYTYRQKSILLMRSTHQKNVPCKATVQLVNIYFGSRFKKN